MELSSQQLFHKCEKAVLGFQDYINSDEEHFLATLEDLEKLVD
jgi:hypothetical protein